MAQEKVPFSRTSAHGSGACCYDYGTRESPWVLWNVAGIWMEELAETHEWQGWSFKMRQYIAAVDEELYLELMNVDANPLRELPLAGMNEPQKRRARQLAFMLTMHTKDRALQMITKLSDPANGFEIWRRCLEEWEPEHRGRYRAMLVQFVAVSVHGRQRSGLGEVGTTRATV